MNDYRSLPRIANSDLTELKNQLFGKPDFQSGPAQEFGTRFHDLLLLETDVVPTGKGATAQKRMLDVLRANSLFCRLMESAQVETPQLWEDELTGLPCKARIDMRVPDERLIVDVKTTSARSQNEFVSNCYRYDYDRQAAFYLDGCGQAGECADQFIILGIQKQKPHNLYIVEVAADSIFLDYGRKKYRALMRSWKELGFRPRSWIG
ncbi:hypothetical protein VF12_38000 [Nostoc linckia z15]|nr:PD-(D/E)XK nuclease-like domain-containing protein [uncultured Arsenicibacter sp.]PHK23845.1 hypothetical protein VF12_38000 [Nostoc linckia z15]